MKFTASPPSSSKAGKIAQLKLKQYVTIFLLAEKIRQISCATGAWIEASQPSQECLGIPLPGIATAHQVRDLMGSDNNECMH